MLPLRYPRLWFLLGLLLVLAVAVGSLLPGPSLPKLSVGDKVEHAGAYFLLMVWFAGLYPRKRHVLIALALVGLGIALDLLQLTTKTRQFDVADILANSFGILVGLVLSVSVLGGWCQRLERLLLAPST